MASRSVGTLALVAFALACNTKSPPAKRVDLAPAQRVDLAPAPLTCANLQGCVEKCPLGSALAACADRCVARLVPASRPFYDALQKCVAPNCANADAAGPCLDPGSLGCKLCAMSHCGSLASTCLLH